METLLKGQILDWEHQSFSEFKELQKQGILSQ
jgi:hypothetical protein